MLWTRARCHCGIAYKTRAMKAEGNRYGLPSFMASVATQKAEDERMSAAVDLMACGCQAALLLIKGRKRERERERDVTDLTW